LLVKEEGSLEAFSLAVTEILKENGYELVSSTPFRDHYASQTQTVLTGDLQEFSFLHRSFVFKRVAAPPAKEEEQVAALPVVADAPKEESAPAPARPAPPKPSDGGARGSSSPEVRRCSSSDDPMDAISSLMTEMHMQALAMNTELKHQAPVLDTMVETAMNQQAKVGQTTKKTAKIGGKKAKREMNSVEAIASRVGGGKPPIQAIAARVAIAQRARGPS
jgi:hypothetical protein